MQHFEFPKLSPYPSTILAKLHSQTPCTGTIILRKLTLDTNSLETFLELNLENVFKYLLLCGCGKDLYDVDTVGKFSLESSVCLEIM